LTARWLAVTGAIAIAFSGILVSLSHASPSTAAIFRCAYAIPALGLIAAREDRRLGSREWAERRYGVLAGGFLAVDLILWHHSIADVGAGLSTVLANVQVVIVPFAAWGLLGERPGGRVLLAVPVAALGVVLISGALEQGAYGRDPVGGAVYGLASGFAYVGFLLLMRRGGADPRRPAGPLLDATVVGAVFCVLAGLLIGDAELAPAWPSVAWLATLALTSQVFGWLLITSSLPRLPAATTSVILTLQPACTVALAALILDEGPSPPQLVGVCLVLTSLLAISAPRPDARRRLPQLNKRPRKLGTRGYLRSEGERK
jgi:drug/metabolite transporter (DMT)-like permease